MKIALPFSPLRALLPAATVIGLAAGTVVAQEPVPSTFVDLPVPQLTDWNDVNTMTVDGVSGATARTIIYPNASLVPKDANGDPIEGDDWEQDSVAAVYWELDDGSGRAPGLKPVTDDFDFPTNNCIMASGERPFEEGSETMVPKTCSDPQSSSKRFFLEVVEADAPIDLVFDLGSRDIRYKGVKDPADDGGEALAAFREEYGIGRIYRVIQKFINNTDQRLVGISVELGTGVGDDFVALNFEDDGVAFELRELVPREFFEGETGAPDVAVWDPERYAHFAPKLFDDGSRARFDPGFLDQQSAGLFPPQSVNEGDEKAQRIYSGDTPDGLGRLGAITPNHFDIKANQAAGASPEIPGTPFGYMMSDSLAPTVVARHDDGNPESESDVVVAWWDGTDWRSGVTAQTDAHADSDTVVDPFNIIPDSQLEQWATLLLGYDGASLEEQRYESLLSDDLAAANMDAYIYIGEELFDETGALKYDSITLRVTGHSVSGLGLGEVPGSEDPLWTEAGKEPPSLIDYLPEDGVPVAINDLAVTDFNEATNIDILANDLLDRQLLRDVVTDDADISIELVDLPANGTATLDTDGDGNKVVAYDPDTDYSGNDTFTYRVTINEGEPEEEESNLATVKVTVNPEVIPDAPVANNDSAVTFKDQLVTIDVLANDELNNDAPTTVAVSVVDGPLNGSASVDEGMIVYTPGSSFVGFERFTYRITVDGKESNAALVTVRVDKPVIVDDDEDAVSTWADKAGGSSGCSVGPRTGFDPLLPGMVLMALGYLLLRRRRNSALV